MKVILKYAHVIRSFAVAAIFLTLGVFIFNKEKGKKNTEDLCIEIIRLDKSLQQCRSIDDVKTLVKNNKEIIFEVYGSHSKQNEENISIKIFEFISREEIRLFLNETVSTFNNISTIEKDFSNAFSKMRNIVTNFKLPKIIFVFTGMMHPYFIDKDRIIISIDFFLPKDSKYRPTHYPKDIRDTYSVEYIVAQSCMQYLQEFIHKSSNETLLSDFIYYGKIFAILNRLMPHKEEYILLSITKENFYELENNEVYIWDLIKNHEILFKKDYLIKNVFFEHTENGNKIYEGCPSGAGLFIAYKLLYSYMSKNKIDESSLIDHFNNTTDLEILRKSNYKPHY